MKRKKNPGTPQDAIVAGMSLGAIGATAGALSSVIASSGDMRRRATIGAVTGGVLGAALGFAMPKRSRSSNPMSNPVASVSALVAGAVVAIVPPVVAMEILQNQIPPPSVSGTIGRRSVNVVLRKNRWRWSSGRRSGRADTRRGAVVDVIRELGRTAGAHDHVDLDFVRPTAHLSVKPCLGGGWSWSCADQSGTAASRVAATEHALAQIKEFGDSAQEKAS